MPHILISGPDGQTRTIASSDNETVARWLVETLTLFTSPHPAYAHINIQVRPLWVGPTEGGAWDWHPAANQSLIANVTGTTPIDNVRRLARAMELYADQVERAKNGG